MSDDQLFAALGAAWIVVALVALIIVIFGIVCYWKIFEKAGREGLKALIPFYNSWTLCEIVFGKGYWMFVALVGVLGPIGPILEFVWSIITTIRLAKSFGKSGGFIIGLIFLPIIFVPMIAFGSAEYEELPEYNIRTPFC